MQKDSVAGTLIVALVLCVCCSVVVSTAAVALRPRQEINKALDIKKNLLLASGLLKDASASKEQVLSAYEQVKPMVIEMATGKEATEKDPATFNQRAAAKDPKTSVRIPAELDLADIKKRAKFATVYKVMKGDDLDMLIFPVHGKGLWSTMYGFLALSADLTEIRGLGFYEHGETPGLGGEIDNPNWKKQWAGKKAFKEGLEPAIKVIKGSVDSNNKDSAYQIDGLSGATITSNGVTYTMQYWLGEHGFGPFLKNYKSQLE